MQFDGMDNLKKINSLVKAAAVMFGVLVFQILLQLLFGLIFRAVFGQPITEHESAAAVCKLISYESLYHIIYGITVGLIALFVYNTYYRGEPDSFYVMSVKRGDVIKCVKRVAVLILLGVAMQLLAYSILNMAYLYAVDNPFFKEYAAVSDKLSGNASTPLIFLYTLLFAPFAEEYIFRGLIYSSARTGFGFMAANVIQALLFALYHGNLIQGVYAFVLGLLLGYAAEHKKSMPEIVGLHMVVNISGILLVPAFMDVLSSAAGSLLSFVIGTAVSLACLAWMILSGVVKRG